MHSQYILLGNIKEKQKHLIPLKSEIILPSVSDYPQYQCVIWEIQLAVDFLCNISYMTKALKATNKFATTYIVKLENTSSVQAHAKKKAKEVITTLNSWHCKEAQKSRTKAQVRLGRYITSTMKRYITHKASLKLPENLPGIPQKTTDHIQHKLQILLLLRDTKHFFWYSSKS